MKKENVKFLILPIFLILAYVAWYFWNKSKNVIIVNAPVKLATIASQTISGAKPEKFYPYGAGGLYFSDRDPSTYKTGELLSFTPEALSARSAFKSVN